MSFISVKDIFRQIEKAHTAKITYFHSRWDDLNSRLKKAKSPDEAHAIIEEMKSCEAEMRSYIDSVSNHSGGGSYSSPSQSYSNEL